MDKHYFGLAAEEVANGNLDAALLVKSLALSDGDEKRGRALYITLRAEELQRQDGVALRVAKAVARTHGLSSDKEVAAGLTALKEVVLIIVGAILTVFCVSVVVASLRY